MATLIPSDLNRAPGIRPNELRLGSVLQQAFPENVWIWYNSPLHSHRPCFVLITPDFGVGGIDVYDWSPVDLEAAGREGVRVAGRTVVDPVADLGRKLEELSQQLRGLREAPVIFGFLALPNLREADLAHLGLADYLRQGTVVAGDQLTWSQFEKILRRLPKALDESTVLQIRAKLYPDTQFERPGLVQDQNRIKRQTIRLQLDAEQESLARSLSDGITIISGVAGSGKSLILCARARVLSAAHPEWSIQLLCYNRTLVRYLHDLIGLERPGIHVDTFYTWAQQLGLRLPSVHGDADSAMSERVERAIARSAGAGMYDAILVDEGQDFAASWLKFTFHTLKPGHGGMVVACDKAQALYREEAFSSAFPGVQIAFIALTRNYRNTAQIGQFAQAAVFGDSTPRQIEDAAIGNGRSAPPTEFILEGPPAQLVWAERWDEQATFIAREIRRVVDNQRAAYRDIAVLYTQYSAMLRRILRALDEHGVPYFWVNQSADAKAILDLSDNSVKVMTVHSSKGMEFPIVFLFGVEALRIPDSFHGASRDDANRTRVAYVGMTRAQDTLYLTYTRLNPIIKRALRLGQWAEFRNYPEDYRFD